MQLYSLQDLPIYSNYVKLTKQKKTRIDSVCHSGWWREKLRKQELEDGGKMYHHLKKNSSLSSYI